MAKRGRPSNKTLKKRKELKQKSIRFLLIVLLMSFVVGIGIYYLMFNQAI